MLSSAGGVALSWVVLVVLVMYMALSWVVLAVGMTYRRLAAEKFLLFGTREIFVFLNRENLS